MSHFCTISVYNNLSLLGWTRNRCTGCSSAVTFCHDRCHQINHSWNLLVFKGVITPQNCIYVDVVARPSALHTNLCGRSGVKGVAIWSLSLTLPSVHPTLSAITLISSQQVTVTVFHSATTRFHGKQSKATGTEKHSAEQTHWNKLSSTDRSVSYTDMMKCNTHRVYSHRQWQIQCGLWRHAPPRASNAQFLICGCNPDWGKMSIWWKENYVENETCSDQLLNNLGRMI